MKPYYEHGGITIYCGDCLEVMPKLDMQFDAIIADLPYGITEANWDTVIPFDPLWENYKRLIKGNGAIVLFGSQPFTARLIISNLEWFKYEWIWSKGKGTGFVHAKNTPLKSHENILVFSNGTTGHKSQSVNRMNYNPQMAIGEPYKKCVTKDRRGAIFGGKGRKEYLGVQVNDGDRYPISVIDFSNRRNNHNHPTQKPVDLLSYLILTYTNPGELILDNVIGSGTTLVAAQNKGRQAIGIEQSENYCKMAVERLRQPSFFSIPDKPKSVYKQTSIIV